MSTEEPRIIYHEEREQKKDHQFYVLVLHKPSMKGFLLSRNYKLIGNADENDIATVIQFAVQEWDGWKPTGYNQIPDWARDKPEKDFVAYWMWNK